MTYKAAMATSMLIAVLTLVACAAPKPTEAPPLGRLVFTVKEDGRWELYTSDVDGTNLSRLTETRYARTEMWLRPSWSPNGERISFAQGGTGLTPTLSTIRSRRRGLDLDLRPVAVGRVQPVLGWSWSPDSTMLAYSTAEGRELGFVTAITLHIVDVSTGKELIAIKNAWFPVWLSDSNRLVFVNLESDQGRYSSPQVISVPTGEVRPLGMSMPEGLHMVPLTASPHSDEVYWVGTPERPKPGQLEEWLWVSDARGQNLRKVVRLSPTELDVGVLALRYFSEYLGRGDGTSRDVFRAWSPDGSKLALLSLKQASDSVSRDPRNMDVAHLEITVIILGSGEPTVFTIPYDTLLFAYADDLRDGDLKNRNRLESTISIANLGWSPDGENLIYSARQVRQAEPEWHFFWYNPTNGSHGEILADLEPTRKAFLTCCGR